jgi:hypothetical protein
MSQTIRLYASFVLPILLGRLALPAFAAPEKAELVLYQTHGDNGPHILHLTATEIHVVNKQAKYELVAKAPKWDVVIFRRDDKKAFTANFALFHSFSVYGPIVHFQGSESFKKISTTKKQDLVLTKYQKAPGSFIVMIENFKIPAQAGEILKIYYRIPLAGIPFEHRMRAKSRKEATMDPHVQLPDGPLDKIQLLTDKWQFQAVDEKDFVVPKGLKPVKTQSEVLLSDQKKDEFNSILEDMGVGRKLGN